LLLVFGSNENTTKTILMLGFFYFLVFLFKFDSIFLEDDDHFGYYHKIEGKNIIVMY
jgi:hypothetical protein